MKTVEHTEDSRQEAELARLADLEDAAIAESARGITNGAAQDAWLDALMPDRRERQERAFADAHMRAEAAKEADKLQHAQALPNYRKAKEMGVAPALVARVEKLTQDPMVNVIGSAARLARYQACAQLARVLDRHEARRWARVRGSTRRAAPRLRARARAVRAPRVARVNATTAAGSGGGDDPAPSDDPDAPAIRGPVAACQAVHS